jgi:DNA (cytosine-5)-methyltransferase 1
MRSRLIAARKPYVIENVEGAKQEMRDYVTLCGSQFGMRGTRNGYDLYLRRHRLFECNFPVTDPGSHDHRGGAYPVYGYISGSTNNPRIKGPGRLDFARQLMGIDWTTGRELCESIPPAYAEYVGRHMLKAINKIRDAA